MALNRQEKAAIIEEITGQLAGAQAVVVAEYRGLSVESVTQLRKEARAAGVYLRVLKNTLARRAVQDTSFAGLGEHMVGPLIYSVSTDPVAAARTASRHSRGCTTWGPAASRSSSPRRTDTWTPSTNR